MKTVIAAFVVVSVFLFSNSAEARPCGRVARSVKCGAGKVLKVASRPFRRGC